MYVAHPRRIASDQLERLAELAEGLGLTPGPGGSTASGSGLTIALFKGELDTVLPGRWTQAMVMALWPSSQLVLHRDPPIVGTRFHLPLRVNDRCWACHDGAWQRLTAGQVYTMDPTDLHGAVNWGSTLRLHLVVDCA